MLTISDLGSPLKIITVFIAVSFLVGAGSIAACGTLPSEQQSKIDAAELATLRTLTSTATSNADQILIGTVTSLLKPAMNSGEFGSVTFNVEETLKGNSLPELTVQWKDKFTYSCQPSNGFYNVGFRTGGKYIVYIRDGQVFRSDAADQLRNSLYSLDEERITVANGNGS